MQNDKFKPKDGTLERVMLEKLIQNPDGVTFMDFIGTGINQNNIDQIAKNLVNGMYETDGDSELEFDA